MKTVCSQPEYRSNVDMLIGHKTTIHSLSGLIGRPIRLYVLNLNTGLMLIGHKTTIHSLSGLSRYEDYVLTLNTGLRCRQAVHPPFIH